MYFVPRGVVDLLPVDWWAPGNLHLIGKHDLHFCSQDGLRTVEWDGRVVALGRRPFPYDRWSDDQSAWDGDA